MTRTRTVSPAALALAALSLLAPTRAQVVAYHDQDGAAHQAQYAALEPAGYRMIALTIYGSTSNPSYAAVWVHRAGPTFAAFHGLTAAQYQTFSDTWWPLGYRPKILTAMGSASNPRFAGSYELTNAAGWTSHGLTEAQFWAERDAARQAGLAVTTVDVYGSASDPRYIAAFGPLNAGQTEFVSTGVSSFQTHFDAFAAGHNRPALVAFNDSNRFVSLWRSDDVGDWVAHHDMTSTEYQNWCDTYILQGRYPISVHASGSGSGRRFAAVWAPSDLPATPVWTTTGFSVPQFAPFDGWVQAWMAANGTRAASLAIVRSGRLVHARGYTRALPGYPITQPTSLFEIASCTKPLTSIAVHQHFEDPASGIAPGNTMMSYFNTVAFDGQCGQITLAHLLTHRGGWDRNVSFDPMVAYDATIAATFFQPLPIAKGMIYRYMIGTQPLDFAPGTQSQYSNFGFSVLGQVLEARNPGLSYAQIMQQRVFAPLGITRPRIADSVALLPGEVRYHPWMPMVSHSVVDDMQPWVPGQYGGLNKENMDSHGAWVMAAPDYAKVLAAFDLGVSNPLLGPVQTANMWTLQPGYSTLLRGGWYLRNVSNGLGGQVEMYHHNGRLFGAVSMIARRADGLSFVLLTNGDRNNLDGGVHGEQLSNIANQITLWPTWDLFPQVGLPAFTHVAGSVTPFGTACGIGAMTPTLSASGTPDVGAAMTFSLGNAPSNRVALAVLGSQWIVAPLAGVGAPGCYLYTDPLTSMVAVTGATGAASFPWTVPAVPAAIGVTVRAQGVVLDASANPLGLVTTRALNVLIGGWQ